jgi:hypothetical protein
VFQPAVHLGRWVMCWQKGDNWIPIAHMTVEEFELRSFNEVFKKLERCNPTFESDDLLEPADVINEDLKGKKWLEYDASFYDLQSSPSFGKVQWILTRSTLHDTQQVRDGEDTDRGGGGHDGSSGKDAAGEQHGGVEGGAVEGGVFADIVIEGENMGGEVQGHCDVGVEEWGGGKASEVIRTSSEQTTPWTAGLADTASFEEVMVPSMFGLGGGLTAKDEGPSQGRMVEGKRQKMTVRRSSAGSGKES